MASAAAETLASLTIASPSRSLLRPLPRRAAAGGRAASIRLSAVPPRGLGFALIHRRIRCPPAARANVESDGDGADASGLGEASSAGDGDMVTLWPAFSQELGGRAARSGGAAEACGSRPVAGSGGGFFLRFDPRDVFLPEDALTSPDPSAAAEFLQRLVHPPDSAATTVPGDFTFRDRFLLRDPTDALALPGLLVLPQSFGAIHLGETFCSYISINNSSSFEAREVIIKAEIQTERQRILLLDTSKSPVESIRSGGRYDFIVEHDVKELGAHTLVCTALYNDGDTERKYLPQFFKFTVSNPLSVRTKVRTIKDITYLEACIENHTKSNLYMDQVDFEPAQQWRATRLEADEHPSVVKSTIGDLCKQPILIRAGGGIYNYLYQLRSSSDESGQTKAERSTILGKFQITWRTNLGEPGRLQTQNIHSTPTASKDVDLRAVKVPPVIFLERPFMVNLCLSNQTDKTVGPFEVFLAPKMSGEEKAVLINGLQKLVLPLVEAFESINFDLSMVATQVGVQKISGITLYAVQERKHYEPLPDIEIFVDAE